jgi:hypothetical protein
MAPYEETLFILTVLGVGAFVAWLVARYATERARERERRARVVEAQIEKFGEAREFLAFAQSDAGVAWIRGDTGETNVVKGLLVLGLFGIQSLALGGGMLVNAVWLSSATEPADSSAWWGTVLVAVGAGSLLAMALLGRLARAWGLIKSQAGED